MMAAKRAVMLAGWRTATASNRQILPSNTFGFTFSLDGVIVHWYTRPLVQLPAWFLCDMWLTFWTNGVGLF